MISIADIEAARARIAPHVRHTPTLVVSGVKTELPTSACVTLKLECLQVTGSFKARGAMNRLLGAPDLDVSKGIVTASGGNHGLAVARTAYAAGTSAAIYLPSNVSPAKLSKLKAWGAHTEIVGDVWDDANAAALEYAKQTGAAYFHPFADPLVVAGQGTLGLEIVDDLPDIDTILVAIGGGGLISGLSTAMKARRPDIRVIGVAPTGCPTFKLSFDAGRAMAIDTVTTRVPTMACRSADPNIFEIVRSHVSDVILVSDDEMQAAAEWLWFEMGIAADLSGAASIAAIRTRNPVLSGARNICALICGAGPEGTNA